MASISCYSNQQVITPPNTKLKITLTPMEQLNLDNIKGNCMIINNKTKENPISNSGKSTNKETISSAKTKKGSTKPFNIARGNYYVTV